MDVQLLELKLFQSYQEPKQWMNHIIGQFKNLLELKLTRVDLVTRLIEVLPKLTKLNSLQLLNVQIHERT